VARLAPALLALAVVGCAFGGDPAERERVEVVEPTGPYAERVEIEDIDAFALRIERFYRSIARRPLDAYATFQDENLRSFFDDPKKFEEYYASLANQVRQAKFRYGRAEEVRVHEFRFEGDELAHVDVRIIGRHERAFRIRDIVIERTDTWRRSGDTWFLRPGRL
jgi:hypothetical protein